MTEKPQTINRNLNGLSTKNDSYEEQYFEIEDRRREHVDKCPVCGSANISGNSETGIACDDCGYAE